MRCRRTCARSPHFFCRFSRSAAALASTLALAAHKLEPSLVKERVQSRSRRRLVRACRPVPRLLSFVERHPSPMRVPCRYVSPARLAQPEASSHRRRSSCARLPARQQHAWLPSLPLWCPAVGRALEALRSARQNSRLPGLGFARAFALSWPAFCRHFRHRRWLSTWALRDRRSTLLPCRHQRLTANGCRTHHKHKLSCHA